MNPIIIGSRASRLAILQTQTVAQALEEAGYAAQILTMTTTGDRILDRPLERIGGKGLFVKELDAALLDGRTQLSVHSLKDMPMELPEELPILGYSRREDPRDVLVLPKNVAVWDKSLPVGCGSRRRAIQLLRLCPGLTIAPIRGNVLTRLEKLDSGQFGAIILAAAGLKRLGLEDRISRYFTTEEMLPAAGQGILAVQGRRDFNRHCLRHYFDPASAVCATAERAFVRALGGGCSSPVAAYAVTEPDGGLFLRGLFCQSDGSDFCVRAVRGLPEDAEALGKSLAKEVRHGY